MSEQTPDTSTVPEHIEERWKDALALRIFQRTSSRWSPGPEKTGTPLKEHIMGEIQAIHDHYPSLEPQLYENPIERALEAMSDDEEASPIVDAFEWDEMIQEFEDRDPPYTVELLEGSA